MKRALLSTLIMAMPLSSAGQTKGVKHSITVKFDYDFNFTPACNSAAKNRCVVRFILYDISAGLAKRTKLVSIPSPPGATGLVKGISFTTPSLVFEPGRHLLSVTAQQPDGTESDPTKCTTWVEVP